MIQKNFTEINLNTSDGKVLLAAISVLTAINEEHIKSGTFGISKTPDEVFNYLVGLANRLYYPEEYKAHQTSERRDQIIDDILNKKSL